MSNNQSDLRSYPIYKIFFDDIEELFLHTLSFRLLHLLIIITCCFLLGIFILLLYRSTTIFSSYLHPFLYALIFYDVIQLLSLITLKYNFTELFPNQLCRWPYYLKSSSESGQCLTIIFLFALSRHQIRYFLTHNHLPNTSRINSRALTFVCLLFIVYDNNWITHLKVEKSHLITLNETKYEINIQELPISLYEISDQKSRSHARFMTDFDRYSQGHEKNVIVLNQHKSTRDEIIQNHKDGSVHEIIIRFPYDYLFNPTSNRTKRIFTRHKRQQVLNNVINDKLNNNSYRINRCTYGQKNFFLSNLLSLIHSITYFILISYYVVTIYGYKIANMNINHHQQLYEKSLATGRRKSAERHKQFILLIHLKQFLYLMTYSHTLFAFIRLVYVCLLTIILCLIQTPFDWFPIKIFFYSLFLINYFSIPIRMCLLFIYLFRSQFLTHIQSLIFYLFHTKLRFSWKLQKPTICFRLQFIPYTHDANRVEDLTNALIIDLSSSMDEDQSQALPNDSVVVYEENSSGFNGVTTAILPAPLVCASESTSNVYVLARL